MLSFNLSMVEAIKPEGCPKVLERLCSIIARGKLRHNIIPINNSVILYIMLSYNIIFHEMTKMSISNPRLAISINTFQFI